MWEYTTKQGDTLDALARDIYGSELLDYIIRRENPKYLNYIIFPSGIKLLIPELPRGKSKQPSPPWIK